MSHYGTYLPGGVTCPGVERVAPRPQDRPAHDGSVRRAIVAVLAEPVTVPEIAAKLKREIPATRCCVHLLRRLGQVRKVGTVRAAVKGKGSGQMVAVYQAVSS